MGSLQTDLFRNLNKVLFTGVRAGAGLKKCRNGEEGQEYFENFATKIILVGRLDVASDNMGSRYFIKSGICMYKSVGYETHSRADGPVSRGLSSYELVMSYSRVLRQCGKLR